MALAATSAADAHEAAARLAHKHARNSTHAAKPHNRPSPLVTTITKIVGVVPFAVRMLIAALLGLALLLAVRSRVAALRARRLERQRLQLLEDVGLLQAALLPVPPARLGPVGTSAAYQPAAGPGGRVPAEVAVSERGRAAIVVQAAAVQRGASRDGEAAEVGRDSAIDLEHATQPAAAQDYARGRT